MQRVKRSTAVAVLPAAPVGGTPGFFASPNPGGGIPATIPGFEWYNGVQEELMAVIEGQGLSGSDSDHTKLRQAIAKMIQGGQRAVVINNATFAGAVTGTGKAVYWDAANSRFDLALADGTAKQNCVGFADVPNGNVYAFGDAVLFAGLTTGRYYLDPATAGAITTSAPASNAVFVGVAKSATEVFIDVDAQPSGSVKQIQAITASVAANALTLGLNATSLDFRSSALTNGVPNTRTVGASISLVVPSTATLGTIAATAARLALLAIDNAGTVELAVVNLAGGNNLDETTLISTTAISAAATAANVIYSTTARASVPFRVIGFIDITEAVAGTWATAPSTIQGAGGQALAALSSIGYGQTWQNVSGSRVAGTTYYNTTGRPIEVTAWGPSSGAGVTVTLTATVNGVVATSASYLYPNSLGSGANLAVIVPPGASYSIGVTGGSIAGWTELR